MLARCSSFVLSVWLLVSVPVLALGGDPDSSNLSDLEDRLQVVEEQNQFLLRQNQALLQSLRGEQPQYAEDVEDPSAGEIIQVGDIEGPLGSEDNSLQRFQQIEQQYQSNRMLDQTQDSAPAGPSRGPVLTARWGSGLVSNGLWFESKEKAFRLHVGGRTQWDSAWFAADNRVQLPPAMGGIGPLHDGTDFRRARLRAEGSMFEQTEFCVEYDFVDSTSPAGSPINIPSPRDLWWNFSNVPFVGNFRVGNQKEPFGFERLQSSRFLNFMERSFNTEAFYSPFSAGFSPGFQIFNTAHDERMTWALGVFRNLTNGFVYNIGSDDWAFTGRLTALPLYEDHGKYLIHVGIGARHTGLNNNLVSYRVRGPERAGPSALWPRYANITNIHGNSQNDVDFELVSVMGPITLQSEYNLNFVPNASVMGNPSVGTLFYHGGYVELSCFLTGEHRQYVKKAALFDRVVPIKNSYWVQTDRGREHGCGAWQVGARYNYLDLNNKGINGGILNDYTFGLSWFLNPNMKVQWNYSLTYRTAPIGNTTDLIQGAGMRFAHDF